jgi:hypothetical protein
MRCWLPLVLLAGCAQTSPAGMDRDLGGASADLASAATPPDLAMVVRNGDLGVPDLAMPAAADLARVFYGDGGLCAPRINEVQTSVVGTSRWEFVELYNPCTPIDLNGWTLVYRSTANVAPVSGNDTSTLVSWQASKVMATGGFVLYGGANFPMPGDGKLAGSGLADDGAIGLRDPNGVLVDSVAYGSASMSAFVEGAPAPAASRLNAPGGSISRQPDGYDTNHNDTDFHKTTPTPGMTNG